MQTQARSFEILNPKVNNGDTVVVRIEPQWQGPQVCISAFGKHYIPNGYGYVFMGVNLFAKGREQIFLVECGRGVRLDSYLDEIIISEKVFEKTRNSRPGCDGVINSAKEIKNSFSEINMSLPDLTSGEAYIDPTNLKRDIIDPYGFIYRNTPNCPHFGVDLRMRVGTPVKAVNKGIIALVARFRLEGNMIILNHGAGIFSVYMHLSKMIAKEGQVVERGQVIGFSGRTGAGVKEAHLHFNMMDNGKYKDYYNYVDPSNFIDTVNEIVIALAMGALK